MRSIDQNLCSIEQNLFIILLYVEYSTVGHDKPNFIRLFE